MTRDETSKDAGPKDAGPKDAPDASRDAIDEARRRLLRNAAYVPPAVIGVLSLSVEGCQVGSCVPGSCAPGGAGPTGPPPQVPCNPNGGGCAPFFA